MNNWAIVNLAFLNIHALVSIGSVRLSYVKLNGRADAE